MTTKTNPCFTGERVRLRAVEPEDLDVLYAMENETDAWDTSNNNVPYSRYVLRRYIETAHYDIFTDRQLRLLIVDMHTEETVGMIDLTDFNPMHNRAEVGVLIGKEYRHRGYATEALGLLCAYAFRFLHVRQLTAHVAADNPYSIRLFARCGFRQCGRLSEWWRTREGYADVVLLQRIETSANTNSE